MSLRIPHSPEDETSRRQSRARILFAGGAALVAITAAAHAAAQPLAGDGSVACGTPYTISSGDSLSSVAARAYGDPMLYGFIAEANWDALGGNPETVSVGMELVIPCIDASGRVLTAEEAAEAAASIEAAVRAEGPLAPAQLDALFGPVALFPDPVLSPLLVAVTFPLDVVKAARFVADAEATPDRERAAAAAAQPWDKSVQDLVAAFPDLLTRMNDHLDWTEQAGEAVLAQTDDVLAAIQRLRAKAQENGYLVDNRAQEIVQEGDAIFITPADPQVVYVPTYDSQVVYTTPVTGPPVYYYDDYDGGWDDALIAGGIILGGAVILDEIFDDDDWDGWGDWDNDVEVDWDGGDITIDRDEINIDRDEINIDRGDVGDRIEAGGGRIDVGEGGRVDIGERGDRLGDGERRSIGDLERPAIAAGAGVGAGAVAAAGRQAISTPAARDAARQKIAARESSGAGIAAFPARQPSVSRGAVASRPAVSSRPSAANRQAQISRPSGSRQPTARAPSRSNAFERSSGGGRAAAASNRGRSSAGGRSRGGGGGGGGGRGVRR
jgi:hypothetical protein